MIMVKKANYKGLIFFYRENTTDENVLEGIKLINFFSEVPEYFPHRNDIIIDVGAHIGTFSLIAAPIVVKGKVFAIEASKESYDFLRMNIEANNFTNVYAYHLALADRKGTTRLYHSPDGNWGHTISEEVSLEFEKVSSNTLANFMSENNIVKCDFLKMNCEGAEFDIILNAKMETLQKIRTILIKYHGDLSRGLNELSLIKKLQECGFLTSTRYKTNERGWIIARNQYFEIRKEELIQYCFWRLFNNRAGGQMIWNLMFWLVSYLRRY
jgi:FkbM family methyltransferase